MTSCYYPALELTPYSRQFAERLARLRSIEETFWSYLAKVKREIGAADIYIDLAPFGERSLPRWDFSVGGMKIRSSLGAKTFLVRADKNARFHPDPSKDDFVLLVGDWTPVNGYDLKALVHHLLPYAERLTVITPREERDFVV